MVSVHKSVKKRMTDTQSDKSPYKPQPSNWDVLADLNMIEWVA